MKFKTRTIVIIVCSLCVVGIAVYPIISHVNETKRNNNIEECVKGLHTGYDYFDTWNVAFCTCVTDCMIENDGYNYKTKKRSFSYTKHVNDCVSACKEYTRHSFGPRPR